MTEQDPIAPTQYTTGLALTALTSTGSPTVAEFLSSWLAARRTLRPSTRLAYEIHLRRHLLPRLGHIRLAELSRAAVQRVYDDMLDAPESDGRISVATIRRVHATLMSALNTAVRHGDLDQNPARFAELPSGVRPRTCAWDSVELSAFLAAAAADPLRTLFLLMALTGLRRGEAVGLRWVDIDFDHAQLRVEQQIVAVASARHVGAPKSANGRRTIALSPTLVRALRGHAADQHSARRLAGDGWIDSGLVFTTARGAALDPVSVSRRFDRLVAATAVPTIRLHDLRHTSASLGLASGESLLEVCRRLGHSSITITADVYSHIAPATARSSANRLADLIAHAVDTL